MATPSKASPPTVPEPKKVREGVSFEKYGQDEVHPSKIYTANIGELIPRPSSAPITTSTGSYQYLDDIASPAVSIVSSPATFLGTASDNDDGDDDTSSAASSVESAESNITDDRPRKYDYYGVLKRAQQLFGPNSRVFVGNLPNTFNDDDLADIVEAAFGEYGDCAACVFRGGGKKGHLRPYAIVQYAMREDALAAYYCGQERMVMGREVRVEFSRLA